MTNAYIYSPKAVLVFGTSRSAARCLNNSDNISDKMTTKFVDLRQEFIKACDEKVLKSEISL